ncbi:MAG: xanthine dehydrogenase family protein subunit M [Dehalococcoidia bacterium]
MHPFRYIPAHSIEEALSVLSQYGERAKCLAGGTDVLVQTRGGRFELDALVDIKNVPEIMELRQDGDGLYIGAAAPCYRLYEDREIQQVFPGIVDAASIIGGIQIQSRASLGGNLCNASPSADGIGPLIIYGATANIAGPNGKRSVPVAEFCSGPGRNVLEPGEILVNIQAPRPPARSGAAYQRFIPRNEMDIAVVGVGSAVTLDAQGRIESAQIALAAVGPTPLVASEAAAALAGKEPTEVSFQAAGELAAKAASPIEDMRGTPEQRRHLVQVLTRRTLTKAVERARENG